MINSTSEDQYTVQWFFFPRYCQSDDIYIPQEDGSFVGDIAG